MSGGLCPVTVGNREIADALNIFDLKFSIAQLNNCHNSNCALIITFSSYFTIIIFFIQIQYKYNAFCLLEIEAISLATVIYRLWISHVNVFD